MIRPLIAIFFALLLVVFPPALADDPPIDATTAESVETIEVDVEPSTNPAAGGETEGVDDIDEAVSTGQVLVQSVKTGDWLTTAAMGLMLLIFIVRRFLWTSVPKEWLPYATIAVAILGEAGIALASGLSVLEAVLGGLGLGLAAIGAWEVVGKKVAG